MNYWHIVSSDIFRNNEKVDGDVYFISDTKEIYRGNDPFTESVILFETLPPDSPALNRLYINKTNLEGMVWDGSSWITVINPILNKVEDNKSNGVSGSAIIKYVTEEISNYIKSENHIKSVSWNKENTSIDIVKGDNTTASVNLDGLGVSLEYDNKSGILRLLDSSNSYIGKEIRLDLEKYVKSAQYDKNSKSLMLYFDDSKTDSIVVDLKDLYDIKASSDDSIKLTIDAITNTIQGSVNISKKEGNLIGLETDGLYVATVDQSGKMDKQDTAKNDNIAIFKNSQVIDSGKTFNDIHCNVFKGSNTIEEAVNGKTPIEGDFCIIEKQYKNTTKYNRYVYIYTNNNWKMIYDNLIQDNSSIYIDENNVLSIKNFGLRYYKYIDKDNIITGDFSYPSNMPKNVKNGSYVNILNTWYVLNDNIWKISDHNPIELGSYKLVEGWKEGLIPKVSITTDGYDISWYEPSITESKFNECYSDLDRRINILNNELGADVSNLSNLIKALNLNILNDQGGIL